METTLRLWRQINLYKTSGLEIGCYWRYQQTSINTVNNELVNDCICTERHVRYGKEKKKGQLIHFLLPVRPLWRRTHREPAIITSERIAKTPNGAEIKACVSARFIKTIVRLTRRWTVLCPGWSSPASSWSSCKEINLISSTIGRKYYISTNVPKRIMD